MSVAAAQARRCINSIPAWRFLANDMGLAKPQARRRSRYLERRAAFGRPSSFGGREAQVPPAHSSVFDAPFGQSGRKLELHHPQREQRV